MDELPVFSMDDFSTLLKIMPEDSGVRLDKFPNGDFKLTKVNSEDFKELADNPNLFHIIYQCLRPGVGYFSNYLEHKYFPPETPSNDDFQFINYKWIGFVWGVVSIPIEKKDLAYEAAEVSKLRIANGIPMRCGAVLCAVREVPEAVKEIVGEKIPIQWFPLNCMVNQFF